MEAIGGLESLIGKEENILLKPNLVRSAKRERAVVTDPEVMDALITILQENGYENISCGDSCGLGTPEGIAKEAGLKEVLEKHNVPLKDFLTSERVETADGKFLMIAKDALDCDALISVSKMKTHALERITGVELTAGTHTVELRYYPQGLHEGLLISGGALFVLAVIVASMYIRKKKQGKTSAKMRRTVEKEPDGDLKLRN